MPLLRSADARHQLLYLRQHGRGRLLDADYRFHYFISALGCA